MTQNQYPPGQVLIIGAGVAGLALAQGLRLRSIPFLIFERYPRSYHAQGHRFRISSEALAALDGVLSPGLQSLLRQTAPTRNHFEPRYVDARKLEFPEPTLASMNSMPLDRAWIRSLMMLGIIDAIEYEKEFISYEVQNDHVRAHFSDGSTALGVLLVGADGIKSRVRKQLQPARKLLDLERWIMWGRSPLTESLKSSLTQDLLTWNMYLDHDANVQTVVEPVTWSKSVHTESESQLSDFSDYIYWALCSAPFQYAESLPKTVEEKRLFIERVTSDWHSSLKHLLSASSHELTACAPVLSSKPDIELSSISRTKRVTLIGDAAHAMSPMGGSGGDTAIRNATDLAQTIAQDGITETSIANFQLRMESRSNDKIEHSFHGGQKFWKGKEWTEYGETDL